jgi:uncharacterized protein
MKVRTETVIRKPGSIGPLAELLAEFKGCRRIFKRDAIPALAPTGRNQMKSKLVLEGQERTFVLILDPAEEAFRSISKFADQENITGASVTAIGAFEHARVGRFDIEAKQYKSIPVNEQCEVLGLIGDIAQGDDGKASLHLHAVLGLNDGSVRGGHLLEGTVRPTLEVTIVETAAHLRRKKRADLGIALIDL